jgi:hypothetical protein
MILAGVNRSLLGLPMTLGMTYDPSADTYGAMNLDPAYTQAVDSIAPNASQVIASQQAPGENWWDTLTRSLPILAATYQQKQILDIQAERARQGLPPLPASAYAAGVQVGLSPDTQKLILYAALGLGAVFLLSRHAR